MRSRELELAVPMSSLSGLLLLGYAIKGWWKPGYERNETQDLQSEGGTKELGTQEWNPSSGKSNEQPKLDGL